MKAGVQCWQQYSRFLTMSRSQKKGSMSSCEEIGCWMEDLEKRSHWEECDIIHNYHYAHAALVAYLLKNRRMHLYWLQVIFIHEWPWLSFFLFSMHRLYIQSHFLPGGGARKMYTPITDAITSTVTLLTGNISFKCERQPVRLLFNDAETEDERWRYHSTGDTVQLRIPSEIWNPATVESNITAAYDGGLNAYRQCVALAVSRN